VLRQIGQCGGAVEVLDFPNTIELRIAPSGRFGDAERGGQRRDGSVMLADEHGFSGIARIREHLFRQRGKAFVREADIDPEL
jgi:hypothetical protein